MSFLQHWIGERGEKKDAGETERDGGVVVLGLCRDSGGCECHAGFMQGRLFYLFFYYLAFCAGGMFDERFAENDGGKYRSNEI